MCDALSYAPHYNQRIHNRFAPLPPLARWLKNQEVLLHDHPFPDSSLCTIPSPQIITLYDLPGCPESKSMNSPTARKSQMDLQEQNSKKGSESSFFF